MRSKYLANNFHTAKLSAVIYRSTEQEGNFVLSNLIDEAHKLIQCLQYRQATAIYILILLSQSVFHEF